MSDDDTLVEIVVGSTFPYNLTSKQRDIFDEINKTRSKFRVHYSETCGGKVTIRYNVIMRVCNFQKIYNDADVKAEYASIMKVLDMDVKKYPIEFFCYG